MLAYGDKVITSLRSRLSIDNVKTSSDNTEDIVSIVNRLRLNIAVRERLYKEKERDTLIAKELSGNYWNLSWYLLFVKDFDGAIAASGRGLDVWEKNNGMITNMALGYLLSGNFDEADKLYDQYKKESYKSDPDRKFRESFLQDLDDLQKAGIISTSNPQVYEHVEAIRKKLSAN
jgi:hypothetical protein